MKRIIFSIALAAAMISCDTKYNAIDTGTANPRFDGNMYEYLKSNSYDWDSIRVMIERADLVEAFEGKVAGYEDFTFLGVTNHSIRRWLLRQYPGNSGGTNGNLYYKISDLTPECCREFVEMHMIKGKRIMMKDLKIGSYIYSGYTVIGLEGGELVTTVTGYQFYMWKIRLDYNNITGAGAEAMKLRPYNNNVFGTEREIASSDIQTDNGVVQAIYYSYDPAITAKVNP